MKKLLLFLPLLLIPFQKIKAHTVTPGVLTTSAFGTYISATPISSASTTTVKAEIDKAVAEGFGIIRWNMDVAQAFESPAKGNWIQAKLDDFKFKVNLATAAGLDVLLTIPVNNGAGFLPLVASSVGATSTMFGASVAVPFTHIPASDLDWHYKFSLKLAQTLGPSSHVFWEIWNEEDVDYFFYTSASLAPSTTWYNLIGSTDSAAILSVDPNAVVMMGGLSTPQGFGTAKSANTIYTGGSFIEQAVVDVSTPITNWSQKLNVHCYQDTGCSPAVVASTMTAVPTMVSKGIWMTETAPFGVATYPNSAAVDEIRKQYWILVTGIQALGNLGFERWFWHTLDYGDFAIFQPDLSDLTCSNAWRVLMRFTNARFITTENYGTMFVWKFQKPDGNYIYMTWDSTRSSPLHIVPWPMRSRVIDKTNSVSQKTPYDMFSVTVTTNPIVVEGVAGSGLQIGPH